MNPYDLMAEKLARGVYKTTLEYGPTKDDKLAARKDQHRLEAKFKEDTIAAYGLTKHPKADTAWSKAWEDGHAEGLHEVLMHFDDLAELLTPLPTPFKPEPPSAIAAAVHFVDKGVPDVALPTALLKAAQFVESSLPKLDLAYTTCSGCSLKHYTNWQQAQAHKELAAIAQKLRRFARDLAAPSEFHPRTGATP